MSQGSDKIEKTKDKKPIFSGGLDTKPQANAKTLAPSTAGEKVEDGPSHQNYVFNHSVDHKGTHLYVRGRVPHHSKKPPIIIVHDLGSNSTPYREASKKLAEEGFPTFIYDQRGHGRSGRLLGDVEKHEELTNDLLQIVAWVRYRCDRKAPYIVAHGLGAVSAVHFVAEHPELCQGLALIWPRLTARSTRGRRVLIKTLAETLPKLKLPKWLSPRWLQIRRAGYGFATNRFVNEIMTSIDNVAESFNHINTPTLFLHPSEQGKPVVTHVFEMIGRHDERNLFESKIIKIGREQVLVNVEESKAIFQELLSWFELQRDHVPARKDTAHDQLSFLDPNNNLEPES